MRRRGRGRCSPPPARSVAPSCDSRSNLPAGAAGRPVAHPSEHDAGPAPGCAGAASARQSPSPVRAGAECCGSDPPTGRLVAGTPRIDPAEHRRLCDVAPGSEVSLGKLLEHRFVQLCIRKKALEADILLLQLLEAFGLGCFHPSVQLLPVVIGRGRHLQSTTDIGDALALVEQLLSGGQLADDLFWCLALALHGASPGQARTLVKLS